MFDVLKEFEAEIVRCLKCGECQEVCPVYKDEGNESFVARGKIRLMRAVLDGEIPLTPGVQERINRCLNCNACMANCPAGINTDHLVFSARCDMRAADLPVPANLEVIRENILKQSNPFGLPASERGAWISEEVTRRESDTAFFAGCAVSYSQNRMAKAALRILDGAKISYTTLGNEERCCGDPLLRMGLQKDADELTAQNRNVFKRRGIRTVFTSCAGCAKNLKHALSADQKGGSSEDPKIEVLHVTEYLDRLAAEGRIVFDKPFAKRVAYMDGCDLGRHAGVFDAPRNLLARLPGIDLREMPKHHQHAVCCGGPFIAAYPNLAKKFAADRIRAAQEVGAEVIAVACPTCLINLKEGMKGLEGVKIDVQEVATLMQRSARA